MCTRRNRSTSHTYFFIWLGEEMVRVVSGGGRRWRLAIGDGGDFETVLRDTEQGTTQNRELTAQGQTHNAA